MYDMVYVLTGKYESNYKLSPIHTSYIYVYVYYNEITCVRTSSYVY